MTGDVMLRDVPCKAPRGSCDYCGGNDAGLTGFYSVPEPTEHSTYRNTWRVLCRSCYAEYRDAPWGFEVEL